MNRELSQISEVPQVLEILRGEVGRVETAIREEGAKAMTATASGSLKAAEEAIAYAKRLHAFISKIDALGKEWQKIEASIAKATPEAREIVRKAGGTHVVTGSLEPKTNFTVTFPGGKVIAEPKANLTLARAIEAIGPARVAALRGAACLRPNGEPLVTRRKADLAKYPSAKLSLAGDADEIKDSNGIKRYYGKLPLSFFGRKYWLTSQFQPHGIEPVLAWLAEIGMKKGEVLDICNRRWKSSQGMLFEDMK